MPVIDPSILDYWLFQCNSSIVILIVLRFGVEFLCCLCLKYVFIYLRR